MIRVILTSLIVPIFVDSISCGKISIFPKIRHTYIYNVIVVLLSYTFLNIFLWQYQINFLILITIFYIISIAMYYIHEFRGTNINISDILSINTAKEVAGGYTYNIRPIFVVTLIMIIAEYILHICYYKIDVFKNYNVGINGINNTNIEIYRYGWHEFGQILLFLFLFFLLRDIVSKNKYDYSLLAGEKEGYIYNFFSSFPIFHKKNKDVKNCDAGINIKDLKELKYKSTFNILDTENAQKYDSFKSDKNKPHVIIIMNESFGSVNRRVKTNIPVTPYYDGLNDVIKGDLYVNTFGGGTANTEFEFLTGVSIGDYPYPVMPYNNFVKEDKYSIAKYFKEFGYKTIAMHPYTATNYNRDKVYKRFGFDELLFFDDFKDKKYVRNFVSDASMYEEVIRRYESVKQSKEKAFIFGITMQNHSGYGEFENQEVVSDIEGVSAEDKKSLDSYLSLMKISDDAIKILIDYFKKEKEKVVILFFGDHNASFGTDINKLVYDKSFIYECTNTYVTPFFIYSNSEQYNKVVDGVSANFLSVELFKAAGLPFDDIHYLLDSVYKDYNIYSYHKMKKKSDNKLYDIPYNLLTRFEEEYLK